ncbi:MAG: CRTAC1 family protein [Deltaproteobacteria bacterium]|nr:CRTAC1 family protein [Deltaproteobacteria bacterium]
MVGSARVYRALSLPVSVLAFLASLLSCGPGNSSPGNSSPGNSSLGDIGSDTSAPTDTIFQEIAAESGLQFEHFNGMSDEYHMAEVMGAGVALFDFDNDGDLDVYLVQGDLLPPAENLSEASYPWPADVPLSDRLFENETVAGGPLSFRDISAASGLPATAYGMGVTAGDYDGDGWTDLYVTQRGSNHLLRNLGTGRFEEVAKQVGADDDRWSVPAVFFDYDGDGHLDLYLGNYLHYQHDRSPRCGALTGIRDYCGAGHFAAQGDRLLRNLGDGSFADATTGAGLSGAPRPALGAVAADFDGDGWLDLYVGNDAMPNHLWINRGDGTFEDQGVLAGAAVNGEGEAEASMGIDAGDLDGDGDLDLFMTHLITETHTLLRNRQGLFEDRTTASGLAAPSRLHTGFGTGFFDFDGDGWLDVFVANGAVQNLAALVHQRDPYPLHEVNQLFRNLGGGGEENRGIRFETVMAEPALEFSEVSRGAAFGDLDNDGDTDIVVTNNNGPVRLLLNGRNPGDHWIGLRVMTGHPGRDATGAMVALLRAERAPLWRRVHVDGSYASSQDPRVRFPLDEEDQVLGIRVVWPGGEIGHFEPPPRGGYTTIHRAEGRN